MPDALDLVILTWAQSVVAIVPTARPLHVASTGETGKILKAPHKPPFLKSVA